MGCELFLDTSATLWRKLGTGGLDPSAAMLAAGGHHTVVVGPHGGVFGFGRCDSGQLGHAVPLDDGKPVPAWLPRVGMHGLPNTCTVRMVAAGLSHTLVVTTEGQLFACGNNRHGQCGVGDNVDRPEAVLVSAPEQIAHVCAGHHHTVAITVDNICLTCGSNEFGQLGIPETKKDVLTLRSIAPRQCFIRSAAGNSHTVTPHHQTEIGS